MKKLLFLLLSVGFLLIAMGCDMEQKVDDTNVGSTSQSTDASTALTKDQKRALLDSRFVFEGQRMQGATVHGEAHLAEPVTILLEFENDFVCEHEILTEAERLAHMAHLQEHFHALNQERVNGLAFQGNRSVVFSDYGPYIEIQYDSYGAFVTSDYEHLLDYFETPVRITVRSARDQGTDD